MTIKCVQIKLLKCGKNKTNKRFKVLTVKMNIGREMSRERPCMRWRSSDLQFCHVRDVSLLVWFGLVNDTLLSREVQDWSINLFTLFLTKKSIIQRWLCLHYLSVSIKSPEAKIWPSFLHLEHSLVFYPKQLTSAVHKEYLFEINRSECQINGYAKSPILWSQNKNYEVNKIK